MYSKKILPPFKYLPTLTQPPPRNINLVDNKKMNSHVTYHLRVGDHVISPKCIKAQRISPHTSVVA